MTVSAARTIVVPSQGMTASNVLVYSPAMWWPTAQPGDDLDYSLDITAPLADIGQAIFTVVLAVSPSGLGELVYNDLTVNGSVITWYGSSGVPSRRYLVSVTVTATGGRVFQWVPGLLIDPILAVFPVAPAPMPGFGSPITWGAWSLNYASAANAGLRLWGWN